MNAICVITVRISPISQPAAYMYLPLLVVHCKQDELLCLGGSINSCTALQCKYGYQYSHHYSSIFNQIAAVGRHRLRQLPVYFIPSQSQLIHNNNP